jgi:hypothetical protein
VRVFFVFGRFWRKGRGIALNLAEYVGTRALWLIWEKCGLSQREVWELFEGMNYAAVAQRLRRLKPGSRQVADKLIKQMSHV